MLTRNINKDFPNKVIRKQRGVVLIVALVVLVAMTLAAVMLVRSVDTNNLIAGNLAFKQSATRSADAGVEAALGYLTANNAVGSIFLYSDHGQDGYVANGSDPVNSPSVTPTVQSWDSYWNTTLIHRTPVALAKDPSGNIVSYVIDRLCYNPGAPTSGANCIASPVLSTSAAGNDNVAGKVALNSTAGAYYRITVRVDGPRNTVSYIQAVVSL